MGNLYLHQQQLRCRNRLCLEAVSSFIVLLSGQWHGPLLRVLKARSRHCYDDLPCYQSTTKKRAILHNQLRPVSLKDLINWLIGFWCNQVIRGSGSHVVHWCIFVLTNAVHVITAQMSPETCALLAATSPYVKVKYGPINFLQSTYCYGRWIL